MEPPWNSLEIAKLVVAVATPVAVIIIGLFVQRTLARQDRLWKARQRLGDRRLAVYDEIRKELHNACYTKLVDRIARDLFFEASDLDPSTRA